MASGGATESGEKAPEPWWVNDPDVIAMRQRGMEELLGAAPREDVTRPCEDVTRPCEVLGDVLTGACRRRLAMARDRLDEAKRDYAEAVRAARRAGFSWGEIGSVLGVSRQALHHRFGVGD